MMNINKVTIHSEVISPRINKNFFNDVEVIKEKIFTTPKAGTVIEIPAELIGNFEHEDLIKATILDECPIIHCRSEGIPITYKLKDRSGRVYDHLSLDDYLSLDKSI